MLKHEGTSASCAKPFFGSKPGTLSDFAEPGHFLILLTIMQADFGVGGCRIRALGLSIPALGFGASTVFFCVELRVVILGCCSQRAQYPLIKEYT